MRVFLELAGFSTFVVKKLTIFDKYSKIIINIDNLINIQ